MANGYTGKLLHVNLTTGALEIEHPDAAFYRTYMGGSAMGMYYVLKETPAGIDPLAPESVIALCASVVTATPIAGQSRFTAVAKSPLTGCIGDSQGGGFFPSELKFSGFDGVIIKGRSPKPVYLWLHHGEAELRQADHLWGMTTGDVEEQLKEELEDKRIEVLQIGPAGENGVKFAAMISMSNRANGRTGMGAVMGSKRLKAIVARGKQKPEIADKAGFKRLQKRGKTNLSPTGMAFFGKYGTPSVTAPQCKAGGLPTFNYTSGVFDHSEAIDGQRLYNNYLKGHEDGDQNRRGRDTCYSCMVRCKRVTGLAEGPYQTDEKYGGPEYETIATFGSYCGVSELEAIIRANALCNMYGMDTISCGATIAWAMECWAEGKLTAEDTGGINLDYGNSASMVKLTEMIARREGFGAILAEGSKKASKIIGRGTEAYLITCKGQELPAHMPQVKPALGIIYAANPFGADHESSDHDGSYQGYPERMREIGLTNPQPQLVLNEEKMRFAMVTQHLFSAIDSLSLCAFVYGPSWQLFSPESIVDLVNAVTGWDVNIEELLKVGERRLNMLRAFNSREGIGREADTLPEKLFSRPLEGGKTEGYVVDRNEWERALEAYYRLCGWDVESGHPKREKLQALGLGWVVDENDTLAEVL